jgi:osmotically inducible lipoprotein OsmB
MMAKTVTVAKVVMLVSLLSGLSACGSLTRSEKHAAIGAAAGGALGYVLTGGPIGTVVGAAAGGLVGAGH